MTDYVDDPQKALVDLKSVLEGRVYWEGVGPQPWWEPFAILENLVEQLEAAKEDRDRCGRMLLDVEGSILAYWTDISEAECERLRVTIRHVLETLPSFEADLAAANSNPAKEPVRLMGRSPEIHAAELELNSNQDRERDASPHSSFDLAAAQQRDRSQMSRGDMSLAMDSAYGEIKRLLEQLEAAQRRVGELERRNRYLESTAQYASSPASERLREHAIGLSADLAAHNQETSHD